MLSAGWVGMGAAPVDQFCESCGLVGENHSFYFQDADVM